MNKQIHVVPSQNGGWNVKNAGSSRASVHTATKAEAKVIATHLAKSSNAELFVHGKNGQIQSRNSYGNDPFPPRG